MKQPNTTKPGTILGAAFDKMSYEYLSTNAPDLVIAIEQELQSGLNPETVRFLAQTYVGPDRDNIARRCEQAARHMMQMQAA